MATKKTAAKTTVSKPQVDETAAGGTMGAKAPAKKAAAPVKAPAKKAAAPKGETVDLKASAGTGERAAEPKHEAGAEASHAGGAKHAVSHEDVAKRAYLHWEERGHRHGSHLDDWMRAEHELKG